MKLVRGDGQKQKGNGAKTRERGEAAATRRRKSKRDAKDNGMTGKKARRRREVGELLGPSAP